MARLPWRHGITMLIADLAVAASGQALADRVPSTATNKAQLVNQRILYTAAAGGVLGVGLMTVHALGDGRHAWSEDLGEGFLAGATALAGSLGMAAVDAQMGIVDPRVTPNGFDMGPGTPSASPPVTTSSASPASSAALPIATGFNPIALGYAY